MHILIVCPYFPPENTIAAIRIAKFAEHWAQSGKQVTVVARAAISEGLNEAHHPRLKVIRIPDPLAGAATFAQNASAPTSSSRLRAVLPRLKSIVKASIWPDVYVLWAIQAWRSRSEIPSDPHVIVASVGPFSTLLLGNRLARTFNARLVVDYRDLLSIGPYYPYGPIRRRLDSWVERLATRRAELVTGASKHMIGELTRLHERSALLVTNGYEPSDFDNYGYSPDPDTIHIVHCGTFYPGKRDTYPLFTAIARILAADPRASISVDLYGRYADEALASAERAGVAHIVHFNGQVTHKESLRIQSAADVLLLLLWNDPRDRGVLSGKLFEYIGARRPILMLGYEHGDAADMIREHTLGVATNDPRHIEEFLARMIAEKRATGRIKGTEDSPALSLTRRSQSQRLLSAIESLASGRSAQD